MHASLGKSSMTFFVQATQETAASNPTNTPDRARQLPKAEVIITSQKKSLVTSFLKFESSPLSRETLYHPILL